MRASIHLALYWAGLVKPETQVSPNERECLLEHARGRKLAAEIGVWHGVTTSRLRNVMETAGTLYAIDPFPLGRMGFSTQRLIAFREIGKTSGAGVQFLRLTGVDAAKRFLQEGVFDFDFVFVDGDHTFDGLKSDWEHWKRLVAVGGNIALHDSRSSCSRDIETAGSVQFTKRVILKDKGFDVISEVETLTVLRRNDFQSAIFP